MPCSTGTNRNLNITPAHKNKRKDFLSKLEHMNINSFSLFQTEDAPMEHVFISEGYIGGNL
jgi:hypothetical protein